AGAHPLLWGAANVLIPSVNRGRATAAERSANGQNEPSAAVRAGQRPSAGVQLVYYEMQPGDHLVVNHPAGVPLLRVTDLAVPTAPLLYAAAIAPYGRGWAVFMPRVIEWHRADGALFIQNLLSFIQRAAPAAQPPANAWAGVPANMVEGAAAKALTTKLTTQDFTILERTLTHILEPSHAKELPPPTSPAPQEQLLPKLLLTRGEITTALDLVRRAGSATDDGLSKAQASQEIVATLEVWAARLAMQRNDSDQAGASLEAAAHYAPRLADIALWEGTLREGHAEDITLNTHEQMLAFQDAAQAWQAALAAPSSSLSSANADASLNAGEPTAPDPDSNSPSGHQKPERTISGIPRSLLSIWIKKATYEVTLIQNQSYGNKEGTPNLRVMGTRERPLVLSPDYPLTAPTTTGNSTGNDWGTLWGGKPGKAQFALLGHILFVPSERADQLLMHASTVLGCWPDEEQILTFTQGLYYEKYRQLLGVAQQMPPAVIDINQGIFKHLTPTSIGAFVPRTRSYGDVVGERILMSDGKLEDALHPRGPMPGIVNNVEIGSLIYSASTLYPTTLGRMHTYVLLNKLAGGGTAPPDWMQLGMAAQAAYSVMRDCGLNLPETGFSDREVLPPVLATRMVAFGILNPAQFRGIVWNPKWDPSPASLAEPQAILMMEFFYGRFGAGAVVETLQRLGAGQTVDDALAATTGLNEVQFFQAWRGSLG
ncbi:MAG: hypothetical protein JOZ57_04990, partial [Abitibacteriaceae bacterium]|nr:hypothetical protein [Abditibacteriaceae bacterium]